MERFKDRLGDQKTLLDALDETNPLPDSFEVTVTNPDLVKTAAEKMENLMEWSAPNMVRMLWSIFLKLPDCCVSLASP